VLALAGVIMIAVKAMHFSGVAVCRAEYSLKHLMQSRSTSSKFEKAHLSIMRPNWHSNWKQVIKQRGSWHNSVLNNKRLHRKITSAIGRVEVEETTWHEIQGYRMDTLGCK
jgi:hypothetical protein